MTQLRRPRIRARRRVLDVIVVIVALLVAAVVVFALTVSHAYDAGRHVLNPFPVTKDRPAVTTGDAAAAVNILVLGTDVDTEDPESPQFVGQREADTVMLMHIPADRSRIYAISILRNSLVDVPGHGQQAINSAYAYGGVELQVQTVEQLLDVRVDHVVDMSLSGLKGLTDALGGVTVDNRTPITSRGVTFAKGQQQLTGDRALQYLRAGNVRATGDAVRATAQERYFRAVFDQVLSAKTLLNPVAIATSVNVFSPYLSTDAGFDSAAIAGLGISLRNVRGSDVETLRVADTGVTKRSGVTVVNLDRPRLLDLSQALRSDALADYTD